MRLDQYLCHHASVKTRSQATDLIKRGLVLVNGEVITKAGHEVSDIDLIQIQDMMRFVSRAGEKLYQAMLDFNLSFHDKIVIDIGASTGGFTDCVLQHGAKKVYTYDVGRDQMDPQLRAHPKVLVHEATNVLDVGLPDADMILIDVSFTSIKPIFDHIKGFKKEIVALIKPQFEAGPISIKQGVLKDIKLHKKILHEVLSHVSSLGFHIRDLKKSGLKGKKGNQEYMLYIDPEAPHQDLQQRIGEVLC